MRDREHEEWLGDTAMRRGRAGAHNVRRKRIAPAPADETTERMQREEEQAKIEKMRKRQDYF